MTQTALPILCRETIDQLFSRPRVLVQFLDACLRLDSRQQITNILQQDAALAVRVIQAGTFSSSEPLSAESPLSSAVSRLSMDALSAIGLRAAGRYLEESPGLPQSRFRQSLWFNSRAAGIIARCLAEAVSYPRIEEAQLAGMLHNIGMQLLFAQDSSRYHEKVYHPSSSPEVCVHEVKAYGCHHLSMAEELVGRWQLESFLTDALKFLHHPQVEGSGVLIRLMQLTHAVCASPAHLSSEALNLAQRHFDLNPSSMQDIFNWVERHYRGFSEYAGDLDQLRHEELEAARQLEKLSFLLAERQAHLARIGNCDSVGQLLSEGRSLLLQKLAAREVVFLLADANKGVLCGMSFPGQSQLVNDLRVPIDRDFSLLARCLLEDGVHDSADVPPNEISVVDQTLLRLTGSPRLACLPLATGAQLGVVAIGLDEAQDIEPFAAGETLILCNAIGRSLKKYAQAGHLPGQSENDGAELRRVVHEISNPLAILGNYLQVLRQQRVNDDVLGAMEREIQRVSEILSYYSRQQDQSPLPASKVDVATLIDSVLDSLKPTVLLPRNIEVIKACERIPPISSNPIVLRQILINLVKNAAEAMPAGGHVELKSREIIESDGTRQVEIVVADNGPGIAPHLLDQLFNPVSSTKGSGHAGLGLNIVRNMANDIGARVSCQSSAEAGTSFRILISRQGDEKKPFTMKRCSHE